MDYCIILAITLFTFFLINFGYISLSVIFISTSFLIWYVVKILREESRFQHVPGPPKSSFFLGHVLDFKYAMESEDITIQDLFYDWAQVHGRTFKVFIFHKCAVITGDVEGVKVALSGEHPKAEELYSWISYLYGARFLGHGLVTLTDQKQWARRRKAMEPAFTRRSLQGQMEQFNSSTDILIAKLRQSADGETKVSMVEVFHRITLDLLAKVAFDMDIDSIHDPTSPFPAAIRTVLEAMYVQLFKGDFGLNPFNRAFYKKARTAVRFLRDEGKTLIEKRRAAMMNNEPYPDDILTHCIGELDKSKFSLESLLDDFVTFFIAGHETTANTLSFTIMELGRRSDILRRLREEIERVVGDDEYISDVHVRKLTYMNMVIKESMRLYPTAPSTFRKLTKDSVIAQYLIPAGTIVMASDFLASRNSEIFEDPLSFNPERFDATKYRIVPIYSYFPFSLGQRNCIGKELALIEIKVILTKFLMTFDFELDDNETFEMKEVATLKPKSAVDVTLLPRRLEFS